MTPDELAGYIDLSLLRPDITISDIESLVKDAEKHPFASICIPPCHVRLAAKLLGESPVKVGTVIGFPFGYQSLDVKLGEACDAVEEGAPRLPILNCSSRLFSLLCG